MDKVYVMDNRGREKEATKVRYFKYNDNCYFVYTLDEMDNEGYVKLYIKKIVNDEDVAITDEEWPNVKTIVQEVFREIKAGTCYSYEDLNNNKINEIMDSGARVFKLKKNVVEEILSKKIDANKALENDINSKLINDALRKSLNEENDKEVESIGPISETVNEEVTPTDLSDNLLNILKQVEAVNEELFETPSTLESSNPVSDEEIEEPVKSKIKPIVVGNVNNIEYENKIEELESEIRAYKDKIFDFKKELEKARNENSRLKENLQEYKNIIIKYEEKMRVLKEIIK